MDSVDLQAALDEHRDELHALDNVVGTAIGTGIDGFVVQVFVEHKPGVVLNTFRKSQTILGENVPLVVLASQVPEAGAK